MRERQRRHRREVLEELTAEIESLAEQKGRTHAKRVCELRASGRYGRYLRLTKTGRPRIDAARLAELEKLDGKFVVHSNDDTLSAADLALERVAEQACGDTWRNIRADLKRIKLAQLLSPNGTVWQITEPPPEALKRLKSLKIQKPPPILHLA